MAGVRRSSRQGGSEAANGAEWLDKNKGGEGRGRGVVSTRPVSTPTPPVLVPVNNLTP